MTEPRLWHVYILKCADNSLYTGITTDPDRRLREHNEGKIGAKYTRSRRPVELVHVETSDSRSQATKREYEIKQLNAQAKSRLIESGK